MRAQIGLLSGQGTLARAVRTATNSPISHTVLGAGGDQVFSAQLGGTILRPISSFRTPIIWSRYPLTPDQEDAIIDFAESHLGAPYNLLEAGAVLLSRVLTIRYPQRSFAYYHCAQLAHDAYQSAGIDPLPGRRPGPLHTGHFHQHWENQHWYETLGVPFPKPPE